MVRALSADGRSLISADPGEVRVWDVATGRRSGGFTTKATEGRELRQVAVSQDGDLVAIADDRAIRLFDLATGRPVGRSVPAASQVDVGVEFGGGRLVVTIGQGREVYDWRTGKSVSIPVMTGTAVHPGGGYAVAGPDLYLLPSGERRPGYRDICADCYGNLAFSPDGGRLAVSDDDGLTVYDTRTRREITTISGWEARATPVFSADGELVAGIGSAITVWRPDADEPLLLRRELEDRVSAAAFGPGGLRYLSEDTVVTLRPNPPSDEPMDSVLLSDDGRTLATHTLGSTDVTLNGRNLRIGAFSDYDSDFAFSRDGRLMAVRRGADVTVRDTATWRELAALTPAFATVSEPNNAAPTPRGLWTAGDKAFTLWQLPGGRQLKQVPRPRLLAWTTSAAGRLTGLDADQLRLVDLETGKPLGARLPLPALAQDVWFSADLKLVAVNFSGKIGVWDTATGAQVGDWMRMGPAPWDAAFSPDGRLFAVSSQEKTLGLWDVRQGRRIGPEIGLADSARSVAFTAGSAEVVAVGRGGRVSRLPTAIEPLVRAVCARAGRDLTAAEWRRHLPDRPYEPTCPASRG
ncbi:WD40 repeat domain-containing protein [Nonomuraea antimicrobica]